MKYMLRLLIAGIMAAAPAPAVRAQTPATDLISATLEDLMNIRVTSAARKSQRAEDVPAAVYVVTRNDIRRSGLTTIPEILRLVPGVQVAQVNANKWAVSIRGFNELYSNKLLVLVDGRSVYSRTFSGVFWDTQDVMVTDIDRIEVIRGPGGAVWGANAVNGVINIITRPATETQGAAVNLSAGTFERERLSLRYGGIFGGAAYRVFSKWSGYEAGQQPGQTVFDDQWHSFTNGFRIDGSRGADALMAEGHFTANETRPGWLQLTSLEPGVQPRTDGVSNAREGSVLGRWTRTHADGSVAQVQTYYTHTHRDEGIVDFTERSADVDAQYEMRLRSRHSVMFGAGYRHVGLSTVDTVVTQLGSHQTETFNAFLQDEIRLSPDLALTLGSKVEHDTLGGWGLMPSARLMWDLSRSQRLWTAVSRTRRTPSVTDRAVHLNVGVLPGPGLPIVFGFSGNPAYRSESFLQTEAGYRVRIGSSASLDATAFTGLYEGLGVMRLIAPVLEETPAPAHLFAGSTYGNLLNVRTVGAELNAHWTPACACRFEASYSFLHLSDDLDRAKLEVTTVQTDGNAPMHQWQVRSTTSLGHGAEANASLSRVGRLRDLAIPAYTRVDAGVTVPLTGRLAIGVVGQNLASGDHPEFASQSVYLTSNTPRRVRIDLRWRF